MLYSSYYCLYSLFNKIRDKSRTDLGWKRRGRGRRVLGLGAVGGGMGSGREMTQTLYAHMNKRIIKKKLN
jgi:hypothetical protein